MHCALVFIPSGVVPTWPQLTNDSSPGEARNVLEPIRESPDPGSLELVTGNPGSLRLRGQLSRQNTDNINSVWQWNFPGLISYNTRIILICGSVPRTQYLLCNVESPVRVGPGGRRCSWHHNNRAKRQFWTVYKYCCYLEMNLLARQQYR